MNPHREEYRCLLVGPILPAVGAARMAEARAIWVGTDLALGSPWREVDDGYAWRRSIARAVHRAPDLDALAIVTAARPALLRTEQRRAAIMEDRNLVVEREVRAPGQSLTFCTGFAPERKAFVR